MLVVPAFKYGGISAVFTAMPSHHFSRECETACFDKVVNGNQNWKAVSLTENTKGAFKNDCVFLLNHGRWSGLSIGEVNRAISKSVNAMLVVANHVRRFIFKTFVT